MDVYIHDCSTQCECLGIKDFGFWKYHLSWEEAMYLIAAVCIVISFLEEVNSFCPSQCTCIYHGRSDGSGTR